MKIDVSETNGEVEPATASRPSLMATEEKTLGAVRRLLTLLHENEIEYCHWKSNEHVGAGLEGLTDLDVLVDRRQSTDLERILADAGFKRFIAPALKRYPGIEDYLGFDDDTNQIVHLHLHHELTIGEKHLKGYHVPWEGDMLRMRRFDHEYRVYVADPAMELVLLLVRRSLKSRWRDLILGNFSKRSTGESDFEREYQFLRARTDTAGILHVAHHWIGREASEMLEQLLDDVTSKRAFRAFSTAVRTELRLYRSYSPSGAALRGWLREVNWLLDGLSRRYLHLATPRRRVSPRGGTVIVLLGSDGAGKSTQSKLLIEWLGKKLDVMPVYLGSGDGPSAIYRLPLRWGQRLVQTNAKEREDANADAQSFDKEQRRSSRRIRMKSYLSGLARPIWALVLAQEKRAKIRRMVRARNHGMIIVCDRFPQFDVKGFNDGPLLTHWREHPWRLCRWLAAWEEQPYANAVRTCPDIVFRLTIDPVVANKRRPEMTLKELARRVAAVQSVRFLDTTNVVDVDAGKPLEQVTAAIKRRVWHEL